MLQQHPSAAALHEAHQQHLLLQQQQRGAASMAWDAAPSQQRHGFQVSADLGPAMASLCSQPP